MSIKKIIRSLDFIGPQPSMKIKGLFLYQTTLGGLLSGMSIIILLAAFFYFLSSLLGRTNSTIMMNEEVNSNPVTNWTNSEIAVSIVDNVLNEIPDSEKIFSVYADFWWNQPIINQKGEVENYLLSSNPVKLEKCKYDVHFTSDSGLWNDNSIFKYNSSFCLGRDQSLIIQKNFGENNYTGLVFWIYRCLNSSKKNDCFPSETIDRILENVWLTVKFADYYYDNNKFGSPAIPFINSQMLQVSSSVYRRIWLLFQNVEYIDDDGWIWANTLKWEFTNYAMKEESVDLRKTTTVTGSFCAISINNYHLIRKYYRKYYKVQNMMADFGGLIKGIILLATIINYFPSERLFYSKIVNRNINNFRSKKNDLIFLEFGTEKKSHLYSTNIENNHKGIDRHTSSNLKLNNISSFTNHHCRIIFPTQPAHSMLMWEPHWRNNKNNTDKIILSCSQVFCPKSCFSKNSASNFKLTELDIYKALSLGQLDIRNVLDQMNTTDKLTFLLTGYGLENTLRSARNPLLSHLKVGKVSSLTKYPLSNEIPDFVYSNWREMIDQ